MKKPWGKLTGVRPTKKARKLLQEGVTQGALPKVLAKEYKISRPKIKLLMQTLENQEIISDDSVMDFYVNIPICPTRCQYCSFISAELKYVEKILPDYLNALTKEIALAKRLIAENRGM